MIELLRDDDEHPLPFELRYTFEEIANALAAGDFSLSSLKIEGVDLVDDDLARHMSDCVAAYGDQLVTLDRATWERSCYRHEDDHWIALVDLTTRNEAVSDLTLHARIDLDPSLRIRIQSVHVP